MRPPGLTFGPVPPDVRRGSLLPVRPFPLLASGAAIFLCAFLLSGCRTVPNLPPADLSQPGWKARQGQGVWKAGPDAPEIAGELLLAIHPQRGTVLQFLKTPFPIVVAQSSTEGWKITSGGREFSGGGSPPARISWFQLAAAIQSRRLSDEWTFTKSDEQTFRLENSRTGEFIDGYFAP